MKFNELDVEKQSELLSRLSNSFNDDPKHRDLYNELCASLLEDSLINVSKALFDIKVELGNILLGASLGEAIINQDEGVVVEEGLWH